MRGVNHRANWSVAEPGDGKTGDLDVSTKTEPFVADVAKCSVHVIGTGTPTGTPKLFASNDYDPGITSDKWNGTWEDVSSKLSPTMTAPAGAGFSYLIGLDGLPFRAFYWDYTRSAGAGSVRATWSKLVNG